MGYIIFALTMLCVYVRPFGLPIWVSSSLGAACAYGLGVVSVEDIALVWEITKPSTLALIGLILLSLAFEKLGFFTHLAAFITPNARPVRTWKFFVLLVGLGSVVSVVFGNDGAVLVLTPLILALFHQRNSSLGNHSQDCGNFGAVITHKVTPTPKLPQNFQSTTANTRILDSNHTAPKTITESKTPKQGGKVSLRDFLKKLRLGSFASEDAGSYLSGSEQIQTKQSTKSTKETSQAPLIVFLLLVSFLSDFASNALVISNLTNIITAHMFGMDFVRFTLFMALPQIFGLLGFVGIAWLCFRRFLPRTLHFGAESNIESSPDSQRTPLHNPTPHTRTPKPQNPTKTTLLLCYTLIIALLGGIVIGQSYGAPLYIFLLTASLIALMYAWALGLLRPRALLRETPFSVVIFSFGLFVVVFGVKNAGFLESMRAVFASIESAPLFVQIFGVGIFSSLGSSVANNLPMVLLGNLTIESFSLDSAHQNALALAHLLGCNIGSKLTPIGSLATLLFLLKLKISGVQIPLRTYLAFAFVITLCVLCSALLGLWVSVEIIFAHT